MAEASARLEPAIHDDLHNSRMTDQRECLRVEGMALREIADDDSDVIEPANSLCMVCRPYPLADIRERRVLAGTFNGERQLRNTLNADDGLRAPSSTTVRTRRDPKLKFTDT
jgi:hypothetical protein